MFRIGRMFRMGPALLALAAMVGAIASCASGIDRTTFAAANSSVVSKPPGTPGMATPSVPPSSGGPPQASFASTTDLPSCGADDLQLRLEGLSPETGEQVFGVRLENTGKPCALIGYPSVQLLDERGYPLPVRYHQGGSYTTTKPPREVVVPTGAEAVVVVAKYRCDLGPGTPATTVMVRLPSTTQAASMPAIGNLEYCGANGEGGADDVYVSPIEPDYTDAVGQYP